MKKYLIAVLLTACLLFSFGTTAFADPSGGQEPNANNSATQDEKGHFGYYLSDKNAKWENDQLPTDVGELEAYTDNGKVKYKETRIVENGNKTTVTSAVPTLEGHTFLGWGDKARKGNSAAIRIAGDELIYCYEKNDIYTVDALWGSLTLEGGSKPYDGTPITLSAATFTLNDNGLDPKYSGPYYNLLDCSAAIEYSEDGINWGTLDKISFTDFGEHTLYARQVVALKANPDYKVYVVGQATYFITKRDVKLTSASAEKEYDGTPLTNNTVTAEGFVNGEGATYNVTGMQTAVGSSENNFTYTLNSNTKAVNYTITPKYGTLTVTENTTPPPETTPTPTPTPVVTPVVTPAPSTDDTTPENTATPAPTATAAPTATPAPAPTAAPAAARAATTIPQTGDNFPAVALVIVMLAAIVGLGITVVLRTDKKK